MASDKFRQELRSESQQWQQDGLITSEQSQQLIDRYQLDRLDQQASSRFTFLLIVVGAILIGLGIIIGKIFLRFFAPYCCLVCLLLRISPAFGSIADRTNYNKSSVKAYCSSAA
jgi:Predicted membrane protein (DUF2157)